MAANDIRKNFTIFVDGKGYIGQVEEFNAPKLALKTEEFRGGGMDAPIEIPLGMEKMECSFTLISYSKDVLALFGVVVNQQIPFVAREALESFDGKVSPVAHIMRGRVKEMDAGTSKSGDKPTLKISVILTYYKLEHSGNVLQEIDVENMTHMVNGKDVLLAQRQALGL